MYGRQSMRFGPPETPQIIKQLMIANGVIFIAQLILPDISSLGAVRPSAVWQEGSFWQPFTYMWLHAGFAHIAMNCFALWMFGSELAVVWGRERFFRYYMLCGVATGFIIASWPYVAILLLPGRDAVGLDTMTLGASASVYGVILGYSLVWPDRRIMLIFPPISFRAVWLIPVLLVMSVSMSGAESSTSYIGHLAGVLVGWLSLRHQEGRSGEVSRGRASSPRARRTNVLQRRLRRWRMRKKLRAVLPEDVQPPATDQNRDNDDLTR